jgi:hypothetical protein
MIFYGDFVCLGCWQVNRVQRTLVEAWGLIRETFVDPTFNHQGIPQFCEIVLFECFQLIIFVEVK